MGAELQTKPPVVAPQSKPQQQNVAEQQQEGFASAGFAPHQMAAKGVIGKSTKLPHSERINQAFGKYKLNHVKVYRDAPAKMAAKALNTKGYAIGHKIVFADANPDLFTVAHEAAHIVQQQAKLKLAKGVGQANDPFEQHADQIAKNVVQGKSVENLFDSFFALHPISTLTSSYLDSSYVNGSLPLQFLNSKLRAPTFLIPGQNLVNTAYPGHTFTPNSPFPGFATTKLRNNTLKIETDGHLQDPGVGVPSQPGEPDHYDDYASTLALQNGGRGWSRVGGLIRDKGQNSAATLMHAINHRLDAKNAPNRLNNDPGNIFMGTEDSNDAHKNKVESVVQNALIAGMGNPTLYQNEFLNANFKGVQTVKNSGQKILYWAGNAPGAGAGGANINPNVVKHAQLTPCVADNGNYGNGVILNAAVGGAGIPPAYNEDGQALVLRAQTPFDNYPHIWIDYRVTPIYHHIPAYVMDNYLHELNVLATEFVAAIPGLAANTLENVLDVNNSMIGKLFLSNTLPLPPTKFAQVLLKAAPAAGATILQEIKSWMAASVYVSQLPVATAAAITEKLPAIDAGELLTTVATANAAHILSGVVGINAGNAKQVYDAMKNKDVIKAKAAFEAIPTNTTKDIFNLYPAAGQLNLLNSLTAPYAKDLLGDAGGPTLALQALPGWPAVQGVLNAAMAVVHPGLPGGVNVGANVMQPAAPAANDRYDILKAVTNPVTVKYLNQLPLADGVDLVKKYPVADAVKLLHQLSLDKATRYINATAIAAGGVATAVNWMMAMNITAAADIATRLPWANLNPILGGYPNPAAKATLLEAMPSQFSAQILTNIAVAPANAGAILTAMPRETGGGIIKYMPWATLQPIFNVIGGQAIGELIRTESFKTNGGASTEKMKAEVIAKTALNINALTAATALQAMEIHHTRDAIGRMPRANAGPILVQTPAVFTAGLLHASTAKKAAHIIDGMKNANVGATATVVEKLVPTPADGITTYIPTASLAPILAGFPARAKAGILLDEFTPAKAADVIGNINAVNPAHAADIIQGMKFNNNLGRVCNSLPVGHVIQIINQLPNANVRADLITEVANINAVYSKAIKVNILGHANPAIQALWAPIWAALAPATKGAINGAGAIAGLPINVPNVRPAKLPASGLPKNLTAKLPGALANPFPIALPVVAFPGAAPAPAAAVPVAAPGNMTAALTNAWAATTANMGQVENFLASITPAESLNFVNMFPNDKKQTGGANITNKQMRHRLTYLPQFLPWAKDAFPSHFKAELTYYTASYDPNNRYYKYEQSDIYSTDL